MITAIDTCVLYDLLLENQEFSNDSLKALAICSAAGRLVISEVVYSELFVPFLTEQTDLEIEQFLEKSEIAVVNTPKEGLRIAARAWIKYFLHRKDTQEVYCPTCGHGNLLSCTQCNSTLKWRNHIISDFIIGGHAQHISDRLLTRDRGIYKRYFEDLSVSEPKNLINNHSGQKSE